MQPDQVHNEEDVERDQPECEETIYDENGEKLTRQSDYWKWNEQV